LLTIKEKRGKGKKDVAQSCSSVPGGKRKKKKKGEEEKNSQGTKKKGKGKKKGRNKFSPPSEGGEKKKNRVLCGFRSRATREEKEKGEVVVPSSRLEKRREKGFRRGRQTQGEEGERRSPCKEKGGRGRVHRLHTRKMLSAPSKSKEKRKGRFLRNSPFSL